MNLFAAALLLILTTYVVFGLHPRIRQLQQTMGSAAASATEKVAAQNRFVQLHRQLVPTKAAILLAGFILIVEVVVLCLAP